MVNTFEGLLALLAASRVRFTLVGGLAVSLNGFVRTTEDLDILVDDDPSNIENLLNCLLEFGQGYARELGPKDFVDEEGAIRVQEDFPLDIFVRMRGRKYRDFQDQIQDYQMADGTKIPYLGADGLILLKGGSAREKDLIDVAALRTLKSEPSQTGETIKIDSLRSTSDPSLE